MQQTFHSHSFSGKTTADHGHRHGLSGMASEEPAGLNHNHKIAGYITFNHGHEHYYSITTGPGLEVEGGHTHYYQGSTFDSHNHLHFIYGYTSVSG